MSTSAPTGTQPTTGSGGIGTAPPTTLATLQSDLSHKQQDLASQVKQGKSALDNDQARLQTLGRQVTDLEKSVKGIAQARANAARASADAGKALAAAKDLLDDLDPDAKQWITKEIMSINEAIEEKATAVATATSDLDTLTVDLAGLERDLTAKQAAHDAAIRGLTGLPAALAAQETTVSKMMKELTSAVDAGNPHLAFVHASELQAQLETLDSMRKPQHETDLVGTFVAAQTALTDARDKRDSRERDVIAKEAELDQYQKELDARRKGRPAAIEALKEPQPAAEEPAPAVPEGE